MKRSGLLFAVLLLAALPFVGAAAQAQPSPVVVPARFACPDDFTDYLEPVLNVGTIGATIALVDDAENLRRFPVGNAPVVGELAEGTTIDAVIAGPACSDGIVWWYVEAGDLAGWTPESDAATETYFISAAPDADADGVGDDADFCPGEGVPGAVDEFGCPLPDAATPEVLPGSGEADADADGVADTLDFCPDEGTAGAIDDFGCPVAEAALPNDADGDAVTDDLDFCPEEGTAGAVDDFGCPLPEAAATPEAAAPEAAAPEAAAPDAAAPDAADADADGVADDLDFCPDEGTAETVDELGCPLPDSAAVVVAVTAEPVATAETGVPVGEGDLRVDVYIYSATLINVGEAAINPDLVTFTSAEAQFNGADWGLSTLRPGDCVQIYYLGTPQPRRPADCRAAQSWLERGLESVVFWDEPFTLSYDGVEIAACPEAPNNASDVAQCEALLP